MELKEIQQLQKEFNDKAANLKSVEDFKILKLEFASRKSGKLAMLTEDFLKLSGEDKKSLGKVFNELKNFIAQELDRLEGQFDSVGPSIDVTLPGSKLESGSLHPITLAEREFVRIFSKLGFEVVYGPEIESDWYNFTALNIPENHPARDMWDTFYVDPQSIKTKQKGLVLRTHTSSVVQGRILKQFKPPYAVITIGKCYRHEATDSTHEHTFYQLDGVVAGKDINFGHMVWTLENVLREFFGPETKFKLLPSYFPFVEPGAELAMSHPNYKNGQWIEMLGCGAQHPKVYEAAGYKPGEWQGFAFGFGLTRMAAMKYGIPDIREFSRNDIDFLDQFSV